MGKQFYETKNVWSKFPNQPFCTSLIMFLINAEYLQQFPVTGSGAHWGGAANTPPKSQNCNIKKNRFHRYYIKIFCYLHFS